MCTRGLLDIYTLSPRACGPRALGVYIRQTTHAHGIIVIYNTGTCALPDIYALALGRAVRIY